MSDSDDKKNATLYVGCAGIIAHFPPAVIWYVLFGLMMHKTQAGTAEWSLYVAYLILSVIAFGFYSFVKLAEAS